ncbi:MAG: Na-K-Cl cotransporter [Deltaproteobacteria bacterium]|nr:Na-K-Cl cotransporter [Deltaproteobacteria bacterium]
MTSGATRSQLRLGAFIGVFTPTTLTILGVIMYLRLGWVVGNAGLYGALAIVLFSNIITLLTSLSLSALATNMRVGVGGAYFLISRSLGLEVGGAIGIPLFLSQALSVTLYCYGLSEALLAPWPNAPVPIVAAILIVSVGALAARSTELALKLQLPIMALIFASILSLVVGVEWGGSQVPAFGPWEDVGFWSAFAVFFPAVTGVLAGVSLSGDLKDPGRAIPIGVLTAVGVGFVVYVGVPFALANGLDGVTLRDTSQLIWTKVAWASWLVYPGMLGAILSSAFGSVLGAPRTLQALAHDRLAPSILAEVDEKRGEPTWALRLTVAIALGAVLLGNLNAVATVLTMFFLTTYGTLNMVAGLEALVGDPSFRPRIRIPWAVSLLGAVGCLVAMFAISPVACLVAILVEALLYYYLRRRSLEAAFGDVRGGVLLSSARFALLGLREFRVDPRNWRPHILVFTTDLEASIPAICIADAVSHHRGIVSVVTLREGDVEDGFQNVEQARRNDQILEERGIQAFCEVITVPDLDESRITVAQANGFGGLDSNTVMLRWPGEDAAALGRLLALSRKLALLQKSTLIHREAREQRPTLTNDVVVWWKGLEHNGDLMLLLAHLLRQVPRWGSARIVLKCVVEDADSLARQEEEFRALLPEIRIEADVEVLLRPEGQSVTDLIRDHSKGARLVFLGMSVARAGEEEDYATTLMAFLEGLPETVLVRNAGPFRGRLV